MSTILHRLDQWAKESPDSVAQRYKAGGTWHPITAREFRDRVHHLALFLLSKDVSSADAGAILSYNCPQWVQTELAMLLIGAKNAGLYPNSTPKDIQYILNHTEARMLAVQNKTYFAKIKAGSTDELKHVGFVLAFDGDTTIASNAIAFDAAIAEGKTLAGKSGQPTYEQLLSKLDPKAGSILIYTSGTTGNPKGALLSHDNLVFTADLAAKTWALPFARGSMFSFLPLCHVAEQLQNVGVGIVQRYTVNYASAFENVSIELPEVQPTLLLCVPRVWEKMMEGVVNKVARASTFRKRLANWAIGVGYRVAQAELDHKLPNPFTLAQRPLAEKLVLSKVRQAMGLGQAELLASGAAKLPSHVVKWFRSLGLEILEDFGQTESTGVICMTEPGTDSSGTVGKPVPGIEFKLGGDGEILTRGRHVFVGYFKDEAATRSTLEDGWLHTGDLGEWTDRGLVRIIGRKKEILKTSGGKMVAPMPIEERLKTSDLISQACMVGDGRKYLSVLVTLGEAQLADVKKRIGAIEGLIVKDQEILAQVRKQIDELNKSLASYEQIKRFAVLAKEFTVDDGEMTPTLKVKRNVIETRYRDVIEQMYS